MDLKPLHSFIEGQKKPQTLPLSVTGGGGRGKKSSLPLEASVSHGWAGGTSGAFPCSWKQEVEKLLDWKPLPSIIAERAGLPDKPSRVSLLPEQAQLSRGPQIGSRQSLVLDRKTLSGLLRSVQMQACTCLSPEACWEV